MRDIKEQILKLFEQSDSGALETKIVEQFRKTFAQFKLTDGSVKISKIDNTADKITGSLKYTVANFNINSFFVFKQKSGILCLGEE